MEEGLIMAGGLSRREVRSTVGGVPSALALGPEDGMRQPRAVNLHNVTVRKDLLGPWVCRPDDARMGDACTALGFALGCE